MKRTWGIVSVALLAGGVSAPVVASPAGDPVGIVTRAAAHRAAGPDVAVLSGADRGARALPIADLDDDGARDVVVARSVAMGYGPLRGRDAAVEARSGADGRLLWGPMVFPLTRRVQTGGGTGADVSEGIVSVASGFRFGGADGPTSVLVVASDLTNASSSVLAVGADGAVQWRRDMPAAPLTGAAEGGPAVLLSRPGPATDYVVDDVLVGRYVGIDTVAHGLRGSWALDVTFVSGADGSALELGWRGVGVGMAPAAALIEYDTFIGLDIVVANPVRTPTETRAMIRGFRPATFDFFPPYGEIGDTYEARAPANPADIGMSLFDIEAAFTPGGIGVGFDAGVGDLSLEDSPLRGRVAGPASLVGLGRGGIVRFSITLPSASVVQRPGSVDGDSLEDFRTTRVEGDSLLVETWSGHGSNVALRPPHQMTFLEGDDYRKEVDVRAEMGDATGDGRPELLIGGGYPCGPRYQMIDGIAGTSRWERPEIRALGCFGRLFPAGASLDGAGEDVIEWSSVSSCCPAFPFGVEARARDGATGATLWETELPGIVSAAAVSGTGLGDVNGDGVPDIALVAERGDDAPAASYGLSGADGQILWVA